MAGMQIRGRVEGLEEAVKALEGVDKKVRRKAIRKAVGEAGKIVLKSAKSDVRKKTGLLRKSLGRKVKVYRGSGVAAAIVGPRGGFKGAVTRDGKEVISDPVHYAHLVERGTSHSAPLPFLKPALEGNQSRIRSAMAEILTEAIEGAGA